MWMNSRKKYVAFLLVLVLVLAQLAAWPTWLTGEPKDETAQLRLELEQKDQQILSQKQFIAELENLLEISEKDLRELELLLQDSLKETEKLSALSAISETDAKKKVGKIEVLSTDLEASEEHRFALVQKQRPTWGGVLGAGATYTPWRKEIGAKVDLGVR